jgi:uncharacterized RDD family membrane protein YckC
MALPEDTLNIDTPENVAFGYRVAGIGSRFLAALADTTIILLLQMIVLGAAALLLRAFDTLETLGTWLTAIFSLLAFFLFWGYYTFFEMLWNGQSPGKRWVGLRVIRMDGTPVTLTESVIRNLVRIIDFMPMAYGIGVVTMFVNTQARRLGDLAAGSLVVHDQGQISIQSIAVQRAIAMPTVIPPLEAALPLDRLQPQDIELAEDYLQRRWQLANARGLGDQILRRLYVRMEASFPAGQASNPEELIAAILVGYRERHGSQAAPENGGKR